MYELIPITPHCSYIQSPAKIGLVEVGEGEVCLIDSGNDKDAGRRVRKVLDANGWKLRAIYNTHSNADHIGGNQYLQRQTGCAIYAPGIDCAFTRHPVLEPAYLYGGFPPKALRHKFLMAQPSDAQYLTPECLPEGWESIPLPGHFFDMVGFRTQEDVVYLADCLSSKETLDKYRIGVLYDVAALPGYSGAGEDHDRAHFRPRPRRRHRGHRAPGPVQHRPGASGGGGHLGAVPGAGAV